MITKTIRQIELSSTPTRILAEDPNRVNYMARVLPRDGKFPSQLHPPVYFGTDETVSETSGFPWYPHEGLFFESVNTTGELWAVAPNGGAIALHETLNVEG